MNNLDLHNKKVAVLGMGMEGLALVNFLIDKECVLSVLDKLSAEEIIKRLTDEEKIIFGRVIEDSNIIKIFGDDYLENLAEFDIIFRSPGISYHNSKLQEAKKNGVKISSQIKLFFDLCPCKIIGVTGTKGKGTTTSLIFEILKKKYQNPNDLPRLAPGETGKLQTKDQITNNKNQNDLKLEIRNLEFQPNIYLAGNIGYPAITLIPQLKPDDIVILELSSFQLMDLEKSPQIAVATNLLIDHLDYHKDEKEYRIAKESIVKYQVEDDYAVLNIKSTFDSQIINNIKSNVRYFGDNGLDPRVISLGEAEPRRKPKDDKEGGENDKKSVFDIDAIVTDGSVILDPKNRNIQICDKDHIELFGHHNLENIAAATIVSDILDVDHEVIREVVKDFKGLPHRLEFVAEINGVKYINDSFATNPEPTMAAINSFSEDKILILGGSSKGADFSGLAQKIASSNIKAVVLVGDEADKIEQALITASYSGHIIKNLSNIEDIVRAAQDEASIGDVVILSPACASFGLFKNYKDRGGKFKTAVLNLKS